ncbi:hypothetical protein [Hafnia paralvei]|uniref:hypothetical protein n=1 Tax=Hafnia paralvei TaxID=546367 RepID=UPI001034D906|nr:hypothetical protein [Hafnia paralvei]TBL63871.1 hypothetical protein EYY97_05470 [Hafnia paralvei]
MASFSYFFFITSFITLRKLQQATASYSKLQQATASYSKLQQATASYSKLQQATLTSSFELCGPL